VIFISKRILGITISFFSFALIYSCENDMSSVQKVSYNSSNPDESTQDLHLIYSDYGFARVEIFAAKSETFRGKKNITKILVLFLYLAGGLQ